MNALLFLHTVDPEVFFIQSSFAVNHLIKMPSLSAKKMALFLLVVLGFIALLEGRFIPIRPQYKCEPGFRKIRFRCRKIF